MNGEAFPKVVVKGYNDTNILKAGIEKYHLTAHKKREMPTHFQRKTIRIIPDLSSETLKPSKVQNVIFPILK